MTDRPETSTWDPTSLLEPDFLVPSQVVRDGDHKQREMGLLWAIFLDGVTTYCREVSRGDLKSLAYREAQYWIFRPESDALTSFASLCQLFQIDARRLRRRLMRLQKEPNVEVERLIQHPQAA